MERNVRSSKQLLVAYDEAAKNVFTDEERLQWKAEFNNESVKLKGYEAKLKDFCEQTGLHRDKFREQVFAVETENGIKGFGKSVSQKAVKASQNYYDIWRKSIGADDTPKTLAKYYDMRYNDKQEYSRLQKYVLAVNKGDTSPLLGYSEYKKTALEIEKNLIGMKTANGIVIEDYSAHFVSRVIGYSGITSKSNRPGVSTEAIKDALISGTIGKTQVSKNGQTSILFANDKCYVTVNPDTKTLVQTNPN